MGALVTATGRIPYESGDVLIVEIPHPVTAEEAAVIKRKIKEGPVGLDSLILGHGARISYIVEDAGTPIYDALLAERVI